MGQAHAVGVAGHHTGQPAGISGAQSQVGVPAHAHAAVDGDGDVSLTRGLAQAFHSHVAGSQAPGRVDQQHATVEVDVLGGQGGAADLIVTGTHGQGPAGVQLQRTGDGSLRAVGQLQFEVFQFRMANEYNSEVVMEPMGKKIARWIAPEQLDEKMSSSRNLLVKDRQGNPLFLFENEFSERWFKDKYPDVELTSKL